MSGKQIQFTMPDGTKILGKEEFSKVSGITMYRLAIILRRGNFNFIEKGKGYKFEYLYKLIGERPYMPNPIGINGRIKMGRPVIKIKPKEEFIGDIYNFVGDFVTKHLNGNLVMTYSKERFEMYLNRIFNFVI